MQSAFRRSILLIQFAVKGCEGAGKLDGDPHGFVPPLPCAAFWISTLPTSRIGSCQPLIVPWTEEGSLGPTAVKLRNAERKEGRTLSPSFQRFEHHLYFRFGRMGSDAVLGRWLLLLPGKKAISRGTIKREPNFPDLRMDLLSLKAFFLPQESKKSRTLLQSLLRNILLLGQLYIRPPTVFAKAWEHQEFIPGILFLLVPTQSHFAL